MLNAAHMVALRQRTRTEKSPYAVMAFWLSQQNRKKSSLLHLLTSTVMIGTDQRRNTNGRLQQGNHFALLLKSWLGVKNDSPGSHR